MDKLRVLLSAFLAGIGLGWLISLSRSEILATVVPVLLTAAIGAVPLVRSLRRSDVEKTSMEAAKASGEAARASTESVETSAETAKVSTDAAKASAEAAKMSAEAVRASEEVAKASISVLAALSVGVAAGTTLGALAIAYAWFVPRPAQYVMLAKGLNNQELQNMYLLAIIPNLTEKERTQPPVRQSPTD